MVRATFRFYEELNDFLPSERRQRAFDCECARAATAKHMIEALGVPHTEVELLLVNGESVGFGRLLADGDRVAVYPKFESLDISSLLKVRDQPARAKRRAVARPKPEVAPVMKTMSLIPEPLRSRGKHRRSR